MFRSRVVHPLCSAPGLGVVYFALAIVPLLSCLLEAAPPNKLGVQVSEFEEFLSKLYKMTSPAVALQAIDEYERTHDLTAQEFSSLKKQRERFQELQQQGLVKLGLKWVKPAERDAAVKKYDEEIQLLSEAVCLLDGKKVRRIYHRAVETYPEGIMADYLMGVLFSIRGNCNPLIAEKHFQAVLNRTPNLPPVLNNLAITEVKLGKFNEAYDHWKKALQLDPRNKEILHNVGRAAGQAAPRGGLKMVSSRAQAFAELFTKVRDATGYTYEQLRVGEGWLYTPLVLTPAERQAPDHTVLPPGTMLASAPVGRRETNDPLVTLATGTGFAVTPTIVMTNRHVILHEYLGLADGATVQAFAGEASQPVRGRVLAVSPVDDLALIECPELQAEPIPFSSTAPPRGTEVAVWGFPLGESLGLSVKMTRGLVTSLPEKRFEGMFFLDAQANSGNSGGPTCDRHARVVGVVTAILRHRSGGFTKDYTLATPCSAAVDFLRRAGVEPPVLEPAAPEDDWATIDQKVARSVFFIESQYRAATLTFFSKLPERIRPRDPLEDPSCCTCNGRGMTRCPEKECAFGGRTVVEQYVTAIDLGEGTLKVPVVASNVRRDICLTCEGNGWIVCRECAGKGIGADIRR